MKNLLTTKNITFLLLVTFIALGVWFYTTGDLTLNLKNNNLPSNYTPPTQDSQPYTGKVMYVTDDTYPNENVNYVLVDTSGKQMVLLKANDQKLLVAEGLHVTVLGQITKTMDGKHKILLVEEVLMNNNASN